MPNESFAFKMKLEAEKSKTDGHDVHQLSRDNVANGVYSGGQVQKYVRLIELIKTILDLVETIESEDCTPSHSQAIRMKELSKDGKLDNKAILNIMSEEKPNQQEKLQFKVSSVKQYFPKGYTLD